MCFGIASHKKRYKWAMIRKKHNQKEIPTPKTEAKKKKKKKKRQKKKKKKKKK